MEEKRQENRRPARRLTRKQQRRGGAEGREEGFEGRTRSTWQATGSRKDQRGRGLRPLGDLFSSRSWKGRKLLKDILTGFLLN